MSKIDEKVAPPRVVGIGASIALRESTYRIRGDVFGKVIHPDGREEIVIDKRNVYTLDGGILASMLFSGQVGVGGLSMLALGNGASGDITNPDIAVNTQRSLNNELIRKPFSSVVYRNSAGEEVAYPTNVIDITTVFTETEASGASLTEMGLLSTVSANPAVTNSVANNSDREGGNAVNLSTNDVLVNYLTFPVIHKLAGSVLALTWRLTF